MQEEGFIFHFEVPKTVRIVLCLSLLYDSALQTAALTYTAQKSLWSEESLCSFLAGDVIDLKVKVFTIIVFSKCSSSTPK